MISAPNMRLIECENQTDKNLRKRETKENFFQIDMPGLMNRIEYELLEKHP